MPACPFLSDPEFTALITQLVERYERERATGANPVRMIMREEYARRYSSWPEMRLEEVLNAKGYQCSARGWTGPNHTSVILVTAA